MVIQMQWCKAYRGNYNYREPDCCANCVYCEDVLRYWIFVCHNEKRRKIAKYKVSEESAKKPHVHPFGICDLYEREEQ